MIFRRYNSKIPVRQADKNQQQRIYTCGNYNYLLLHINSGFVCLQLSTVFYFTKNMSNWLHWFNAPRILPKQQGQNRWKQDIGWCPKGELFETVEWKLKLQTIGHGISSTLLRQRSLRASVPYKLNLLSLVNICSYFFSQIS